MRPQGRARSGWWSITLLATTILDIYVVIRVGQAIGLLPLLGIFFAQAIVGAWLIRRSGSRARQAIATALEAGELPTGAVYDGLVTMVGGALVMIPGFLNTAFGLFLLFPPTRRWTRYLLGWVIARSAVDWSTGVRGGPETIEGEVVDVHDAPTTPPPSGGSREPRVIEAHVIEGRVIE